MVDREAPPEVATVDRFRTLADNIREIFWILDPRTGKLLYINPAFTRITGLPVQDGLPGRRFMGPPRGCA